MSDILTQEQFEEWAEALQIGCVGSSKLLGRLLDHDAALRARVEALERENRTLKACQCDGCSNRLEDAEAFCLNCYQKMVAQVADLTAKCEELERERGECVRDMSGWMDNGQTLSLAICAMRLNASTLKQQVADLTARLAAKEHERERLTLALRYLSMLGGGRSEGNYYAQSALEYEARRKTPEVQP